MIARTAEVLRFSGLVDHRAYVKERHHKMVGLVETMLTADSLRLTADSLGEVA